MKLSLKNVRGRMRLVVKSIGNAMSFVKDCCCFNQDNVYLFAECCDGIVRFAITQRFFYDINDRCRPYYIVKRTGDTACHTLANGGLPITRTQAENLGYPVFDIGETSIVCYPTDPTVSQNCGALPDVCRPCPTQCCLVQIYPKNCATYLQIPDPLPKNNYCCNYGSHLRRTMNYDYSLLEIDNTSYFDGIENDPYCPSGCQGPFFKSRGYREVSYTETTELKSCDINGQPLGDQVVSCNASFYQRREESHRRYGFQGEEGLACLEYRDYQGLNEETRDNECRFPYVIFPPEQYWRQRPGVTRGSAFGEGCSPGAIVPITNGDTVSYRLLCEDLNGYVYECIDRQYGIRTVQTTTYHYDAGCYSGLQRLEITTDRYAIKPDGWDDSRPVCPPVGRLMRRTIYKESCSYSIQSLSNINCGPYICEGYAKHGTLSSFPINPNPLPITGALSLL